jgi:hypothetical protein
MSTDFIYTTPPAILQEDQVIDFFDFQFTVGGGGLKSVPTKVKKWM